jgi:hypothetical protein
MRHLLPQQESGDHRSEIRCCGQRFDMTTGEDMQGCVRDEVSQDPGIRDRNDRIGIATLTALVENGSVRLSVMLAWV